MTNPHLVDPSTATVLRRELEGLVTALSGTDEELLNLLRARAEQAARITHVREQLGLPSYDPKGEEETLARIDQLATTVPARLTRAAARQIYRSILSSCAGFGSSGRVGFLGPPGTYSHMAARGTFGLGATYLDYPNIAAVFAALEAQRIDYAIVPIENSTEGGVSQTLDCLLTSSARIQQEQLLDVSLCLIGKEDDLSKVLRVYSHPQPLGQSRSWLSEHLPHAQLIATPSTTAAAREAASDPASAAVASHLAAELNDLDILAEAIQDVTDNITRFVVLSFDQPPATGHDKTSIVFSMPDERGSLLKALSIFDASGLNLSRIESRPGREKLWEYVFFTDIDGHQTEPGVHQAIEQLRSVSQMVRVLGSYPRAD